MYKLKSMFKYTKLKDDISEIEYRKLTGLERIKYEKAWDDDDGEAVTQPLPSFNTNEFFNNSNDNNETNSFEFSGGESGGAGASGDW